MTVLRTWTQEMIDNMLKTRKLALTKRKEQGKSDMHNLTGILRNYVSISRKIITLLILLQLLHF